MQSNQILYSGNIIKKSCPFIRSQEQFDMICTCGFKKIEIFVEIME